MDAAVGDELAGRLQSGVRRQGERLWQESHVLTLVSNVPTDEIEKARFARTIVARNDGNSGPERRQVERPEREISSGKRNRYPVLIHDDDTLGFNRRRSGAAKGVHSSLA